MFVAGASGVLGRRVVDQLVAGGHAVTANVRNDDARRRAEAAGASATTVDLFDADATLQVGAEHDAIVNVATSIPSGLRAARPAAWKMNDRLRIEASANLAAAAGSARGRYVGESITFPYVDSGDEWIDESTERTFFSGNESVENAEAAALGVTQQGGAGVSLRFGMFFADDSAHVELFKTMARRGIFGVVGRADAYASWIHIDDAATAVVAALDAPPGVYNVAEPDPQRRTDQAAAVARSVGRQRLRFMPAAAVRLGGAALDSLSRSQRVSSSALMSVTDWQPRISVIDSWS